MNEPFAAERSRGTNQQSGDVVPRDGSAENVPLSYEGVCGIRP